jgi:hypothetical protein
MVWQTAFASVLAKLMILLLRALWLLRLKQESVEVERKDSIILPKTLEGDWTYPSPSCRIW